MHFDGGVMLADYRRYMKHKQVFLCCLVVGLLLAIMVSVSVGAVPISFSDLLAVLMNRAPSRRLELIIYSIRLPQTLTAVVAGAGLAGAGTVMQSVLRNPLASPFTLGISHAAAFGAALSVMVLGSGTMGSALGDAVSITSPVLTLVSAFTFAMGTACLITSLARTRGASPEVMVLIGVALGALFTAGTMLLQFFADDVQLAAMVFWTFGDVARTDWNDLVILSVVTIGLLGFHLMNALNYNAMDVGDETAHGLGVRVTRVRLVGMMAASLVTSVIISFVGIIGFIGLVAPHMVRQIIGDDHRFLLPASIVAGALILLVSDMAARLVLLPHVLPVS
ncbi:iron ABC transporter permease, partial [Desulfoluna sp.]|uniref:FecCD family ABC transporter permease n=1 Tax=Desulfoluna sp. TaxID=2045199 RepID=UPI00261ED819